MGKWILGGLGLVGLTVAALVYLSMVMAWGDRRTDGIGYYGDTARGRARFKRLLRLHALLLLPVIRILGRLAPMKMENATFRVNGVPGPKGTCSESSFGAGMAYSAQPEDVFVATQMKCGTTWMQHVVYEVLLRGQGDLVDSGTTLYAVCPWLEAKKSVPVHEAPLLGTERPSRIIKTHLPAEACPESPEARYVYVARHPVSCFASCKDFIATNAGSFAPPTEAVEAWFTGDDTMWWGTWPTHVAGWWDRAGREANVLFVTFEDMKRDLGSVVTRLAEFLDMAPLSEEEIAEVLRKCSFGYMQRHAEAFEMHPPHLLQADAELFVRGTADRHKDVPAELADRLRAWCGREMAGTDYPLADVYPDVAEAAPSP